MILWPSRLLHPYRQWGKTLKTLVFNCGSSSIKFKLFSMPDEVILADGSIQRVGSKHAHASLSSTNGKQAFTGPIMDYSSGFSIIKSMLIDPAKGPLDSLENVGACGHRVVHGGESYTGSMEVNDALQKGIESVFELAPLHSPPNLTGIQQASLMLGAIPQIACFDTAFHHTLPEKAFRYALPESLYTKYKIRRYGFHGISHRFVARRAAKMLGRDKYDINVISCHLGNGSSLAAILNGHSVDTSMGLTPLEGLVMGTRSGDIDPGILFFLHRKGYDTDALDSLLNKESGLLGVSGLSNDVRDLEEKSLGGNEKARLALDLFAYRIKKYIGAYMAVLNRVDGIIFTGGIGENGVEMRSRILSEMGSLGIELDPIKNERMLGVEGSIHATSSSINIFVIPTDEELAIARDTYQLTKNKQRKQ